MPGFTDQLALERLGLILQFVAGLLLIESIFTDQVVRGLTGAFDALHRWIRENVEAMAFIVLVLCLGTGVYAIIRAYSELGIPFWPPSFTAAWEVMIDQPGKYFSTMGIAVGVLLGPLIGFYLLSWLVYKTSIQLSRAKLLRRAILILGIILMVLSFVVDYGATLILPV